MLARLIHGFTLNLVLSFGDLSQQTGYRTRVLGELRHLDMQMDPETFLLVFDRYPKKFQKNAPSGVPFRVHARSGVLRFYSQLARLSRKGPIRVVHAHNLYSTALALSARPFYGYKVLLDYHGRIPEEYVYLGKGGERSILLDTRQSDSEHQPPNSPIGSGLKRPAPLEAVDVAWARPGERLHRC